MVLRPSAVLAADSTSYPYCRKMLKPAPASLALSKRQVARAANNLTHARMTEEVRVDRCRFASRAVL
jgi:hypothetical protein